MGKSGGGTGREREWVERGEEREAMWGERERLVKRSVRFGVSEREKKDMSKRSNNVKRIVKGFKLIMCNAHNQDTCHLMNGKFVARTVTRFVIKHCPTFIGLGLRIYR